MKCIRSVFEMHCSADIDGSVSVCWCRLQLAAAFVYCLCGWETVDVLAVCGWHLGQHERGLLMDLQRLRLVREMERVMQTMLLV